MIINEKLNELFDLLDNNSDIKKINKLKNRITDVELKLIDNYRNNPSLENKKKLYDNNVIKDYLICENNINYLIMEINKRFKRRKVCQK